MACLGYEDSTWAPLLRWVYSNGTALQDVCIKRERSVSYLIWVYCKTKNAGVSGEPSFTVWYVRGVNNPSLIMSPYINCLPVSAIWMVPTNHELRCYHYPLMRGVSILFVSWLSMLHICLPIFRINTKRTGSVSSGRLLLLPKSCFDKVACHCCSWFLFLGDHKSPIPLNNVKIMSIFSLWILMTKFLINWRIWSSQRCGLANIVWINVSNSAWSWNCFVHAISAFF